MPQLTQLPDVFWSQLFWLTIVFGIIFFAIGLGMVPKIEATVDSRDQRVTEDLAAAERARQAANEIEDAYRERMEQSRAEALKVTQASKQEGARDTETRVKEADAALREKTEAAEIRLREASQAAMAEIEGVAVEVAQELVAKLTGISVPRDEAQRAVSRVMADV